MQRNVRLKRIVQHDSRREVDDTGTRTERKLHCDCGMHHGNRKRGGCVRSHSDAREQAGSDTA